MCCILLFFVLLSVLFHVFLFILILFFYACVFSHFFQLLERYKNFEFSPPYQHALAATQSCMEMPKWGNDDKLKVMEGEVFAVLMLMLAVDVVAVGCWLFMLMLASDVDVDGCWLYMLMLASDVVAVGCLC